MAAEGTKTKGSKPAAQRTKKKPTKYYESETESDSDYSSEEEEVERPTRGSKQQSGGGTLPVSGVGKEVSNTLGEVSNTANGLVGSASNTLGNVTGSALQNQGGDKDEGKKDTLKLRLDLNLDVEITLKARIHGDLELALLTS